ncbi:hypothetical protein Patl1_29150 [Pistacia atlantica]|uniref:Uncharacterized protein n=1 Tax=Pistacia atlantica TaxID=434234 RepID=A0ACC1BBW6_9ROSI|nr:hypothetical protein Patl1_29150 [Pistacia atlantica]
MALFLNVKVLTIIYLIPGLAITILLYLGS